MAQEHDQATYAGYADEAHYNVGRYRGLALVSMPAAKALALCAEVVAILQESRATESKWEKVRSAKSRFTAQKLLRWTVDHALAGSLRINVLTWDTGTSEDQRQGTHHVKRLRSMYLHLFTCVLQTRWPDAHRWRLYPDEQQALDWHAMEHDLRNAVHHEPARPIEVERIVPCVSHDEPFVQIADLFAGLGVFSREGYDDYERWLCAPHEDRDEPAGEQEPPVRLSGSLRQRCLILDEFYTECKLRGLPVSLRTNRGLRTYDVHTPIAFAWHASLVQ